MWFYKEHWPELVLFTVAVACNGVMDILDFYVPRNSGFWSINGTIALDGWHLVKYVMMAALIAAIAYKKRFWAYLAAALALINYGVHEFVLHILGGQ